MRDPEGSKGPEAMEFRRVTDAELADMREGLDQTNAIMTDIESCLTVKMVGMNSDIANILASETWTRGLLISYLRCFVFRT